MKSNQPTKEKNTTLPRSPVVAVLGHIDHGKSTLLDFIRKTEVVASEAGGITQHLGAYEIVHKTKDGKEHKITFLDTPGHEAFAGIRARGASVADIAVLVVSAEDGVKVQTKEALRYIVQHKLPYLVAITKTDKPNADIERTKQSLAEAEIYLEGYGGQIPFVALSAKTGEGVSELLDTILLMSELEAPTGNPNVPATGFVIETALDRKSGIRATLIIKNGTLRTGMSVAAGGAFSSVRIMEDQFGKKISVASFSTPVAVVGWNALPTVGNAFQSFEDKKTAEKAAEGRMAAARSETSRAAVLDTRVIVPLIVKADTAGSIEAILHEIKKFPTTVIVPKILHAGVGDIGETDAKKAAAAFGTLLIGFHVRVDGGAQNILERENISAHTFDIIYKLSEWLTAELTSRVPKISVEEIRGKAKVLKIFKVEKDKQVIGGKVLEGILTNGDEIRIIRRDSEISKGKIRELQKQKEKVSEVPKDFEFGALIQCSMEIAPGDRLEAVVIVTK